MQSNKFTYSKKTAKKPSRVHIVCMLWDALSSSFLLSPFFVVEHFFFVCFIWPTWVCTYVNAEWVLYCIYFMIRWVQIEFINAMHFLVRNIYGKSISRRHRSGDTPLLGDYFVKHTCMGCERCQLTWNAENREENA